MVNCNKFAWSIQKLRKKIGEAKIRTSFGLSKKFKLRVFSHVSDEEVSPIIAFWSQWTKKQQEGVTER